MTRSLALCQLKSCHLLHNCTRDRLSNADKKTHLKKLNTFKKVCNRWMTLKVTQCHRNCRHSMDQPIYHFLLVVWSNNVFILQRLRDTTTCSVYVTACNFEPWISLRRLKLQATCAFQFMCTAFVYIVVNNAKFPKLWELKRFKTAKVTIKVISDDTIP